ncbi:hypothetical protein BJ508DRAFT_365058 [Ascobolus immersus RN42]|uniref:Uncharacterized protein n=1 Tax=Ascobolus immersus RN42 TaxID=1160509 RepID=A0A3N4I3F2_ASCIM|nr:hypothetical protein BJ508DRAFT_365058 [Ascobolus immersus RN42]
MPDIEGPSSPFLIYGLLCSPQLTEYSGQLHWLLLDLPTVEDFENMHCCPPSDMLTPANFVHRLERLSLRSCFVNAQGLQGLLQRLPRLRSLELVLDSGATFGLLDNESDVYDEDMYYSPLPDNPDSINNFAEALSVAKSTLEDLVIVADNTLTYMDQSGWIGDLRPFSNLRKLVIDNHFAALPRNNYGNFAEYLPAKLDHLRIQKDVKGRNGPVVVLYDGCYDQSVDAGEVPTFRYPCH